MDTNTPAILKETPYSSGVDLQLAELLSYKQHGKLALNENVYPLPANFQATI